MFPHLLNNAIKMDIYCAILTALLTFAGIPNGLPGDELACKLFTSAIPKQINEITTILTAYPTGSEQKGMVKNNE